MNVVREENEELAVDLVEKEEVKKTPELCAVPKEFVIDKLNALYKEHKDIFDEHNMWIQVLNSQVNVVNQEETI